MSAAAATDKVTYRDLYERWEAGNWSAAQLDFTQDHHDWHAVLRGKIRPAGKLRALWRMRKVFPS
jgi:hypothetical protein